MRRLNGLLYVALVLLLSTRTAAQANSPQRAVQIVAHEDDDLLFMNPDILDNIRSGGSSLTIYLTAGDDGREQPYWLGREQGIQAAYAQMARTKDSWTDLREVVNGHPVTVHQLAGRSEIRLIFLRLPDGNMNGQGFVSTGSVSLQKLWRREINEFSSVDGAHRLTREALVAVLGNLLQRERMTLVRTLDRSGYYAPPFGSQLDHSDHFHSAMFALEALRSIGKESICQMYRGYNMSREPPNLGPLEGEKTSVFVAYAIHNSEVCASLNPCVPKGDYAQWVRRQYPVSQPKDTRDSIVGLGKCLDVRGHDPSNGTPIQLYTCKLVPQQKWKLTNDGHIQGLSGKCLDVRGHDPSNGTPIQLYDCKDVPQQKWILTEDGHLRGLAGKCIDVRSGQDADGTPIQLYECADVPQQRWTIHH